MTVTIDTRRDISLVAYERVTRGGESVRLSPQARERMRAGHHRRGGIMTRRDGRRLAARMASDQGTVPIFGTVPIAAGLARGVVLARLTDLVDGLVGVRPEVVDRLATLIGDSVATGPHADCRAGPGEALVLSRLLADVIDEQLESFERRALLGGCPCAAALAAESALEARARTPLVIAAFALSVDALSAPLEAYDAILDMLWDDPHEAAALSGLRHRLHGTEDRRLRWHQAPVSWRILPRLLACHLRAVAGLESAASTALSSVGAEQITVDGPHGPRVIDPGGGYDAAVGPALDAVTAAAADLTRLAERHVTVLHRGSLSGLPDDLRGDRGDAGSATLGFVTRALAEQARAAARRSLLCVGEGGGDGYDDIGGDPFAARDATVRAGCSLDAALAALVITATRALVVTGRATAPRLQALVTRIRDEVPSVAGDGSVAVDLDVDLIALAGRLRADAVAM